MSAIILLLSASISVAGLFLIAFIWSVKDGQYDDDFSPAQRILFDAPIKDITTDPADEVTRDPGRIHPTINKY